MKYRKLPPLTTEEQTALEASIIADGIRVPIVVDDDGNILDGHHRAMFAEKHGKGIPQVVLSNKTEPERNAYVFQANFARRNLSFTQKQEATREMKRIAKDLRQEGKTQEEAARLLGVSGSTISEWENINSSSSGNAYDARTKVPRESYPKIFERVIEGESQEQVAADFGVTQPRISQIVEREQKKVERKQLAQNMPPPPVWQGDWQPNSVYLADMTDIAQINLLPKSTVDMIFTDPPWAEDALECYESAGRIASRVLKPGAFMAIYCGKMFLPEIYHMLTQWLEYVWTYCVFQPDNNWKITRSNVGILEAWRPIGLFRKSGDYREKRFEPDALKCTRQKSWHEWQQGTEPVEKYMDMLTEPGELVLDPFVGGGSVPWVAQKLSRHFLAFDKNEETIKTALLRINGRNDKELGGIET